jgi:hypothetical protein
MIEIIRPMALPSWLSNLTEDNIKKDPFPLTDILQDSLYYPGAGHDGRPVKWLSGNVYSFVYTDYGVSKQSVILGTFKGYKKLAYRDVKMVELIPSGWAQPITPNANDGNPKAWEEIFEEPYAIWTIYERIPNFSENHGPERFSLLYICCDGVAGYQALYNANKIKPKILFLINHGFGCNWTNFEDPGKILARSVRANINGLPDFLVGRKENEQGTSCFWPNDYPTYLGRIIFRLFESDRFIWSK